MLFLILKIHEYVVIAVKASLKVELALSLTLNATAFVNSVRP